MNSIVLARVALALAVVGSAACVLIHVGAWLGRPAPFQVTFVLFAGCIFVWWRALTVAWAAFGTREVRPLWQAVTARCPWLKVAYLALTYYFMMYFLWILYAQFGKGTKPDPALWARFFSAGALVFYVAAAGFLVAAARAEPRSEGTQTPGDAGEQRGAPDKVRR